MEHSLGGGGSRRETRVGRVAQTQEEGGITAEIEGLLGVQNLRRAGWVGIIFQCRHINGAPTPDGGVETDRAAYFSLTELEALEEPVEPWCAWIVRRVLRGRSQPIPAEPDNPYQPHLAFL